MCGPAVLPALAIASAVVTAGGQIYAGSQQARAATYQAQVADQNAKLADQQAADAETRGAVAAQQHYQQVSKIKGEQQAAMSANGIDTNFGTALNAQEDTSAIASQDTGTIYQNTARESKGYLVQAANYQDEAASDRAKATGAIVSTAFGVASTALGGATQYGKLKAGMGSAKLDGN